MDNETKQMIKDTFTIVLLGVIAIWTNADWLGFIVNLQVFMYLRQGEIKVKLEDKE